MAMQVLIIIRMAGSNFIVIPFSYYNADVSKLLLHLGVDLGFTGRRTILSIESLKQGVWGRSPSEAKGYLILLGTKIPCNPPLTLYMNILIFT